MSQAPGTIEHRSITVVLQRDHNFSYHDPMRGPRWASYHADLLEDVLCTTEAPKVDMNSYINFTIYIYICLLPIAMFVFIYTAYIYICGC